MNSTIKELQKIEVHDKRISIIQSEIDRLEAAATNTTANYGGEVVAGSRNQDKMGDSAAEIADLRTAKSELNQKRNTYLMILNRIPEVVDKAKEASNQIDVLYKHYFEYKTFGEIAAEMHYGERNVCYIHGRALQSYAKLLEGVEDETL